ncbi:hypothetical protein [Luteibacter sp. UNCMF366Tsu5.1]|uniref:hypothetical protein n=1 Tax=Luteibacter sp. UNCMF366Tsu5.1 TaxID=1502758 RepID=UPI0009309C08|nr:hypothetical protein [Luteibacter sp. UNCMF366Tsu5.1]
MRLPPADLLGLALTFFLGTGEASALARTTAPSAGIEPWMVGYWKVSKNEAPLPPDTFGIEADGTYIMQGVNCGVDIRGKAHVFDGEIFTRLILPGKGPIGFILKPDGQGSLTFTSTRTQRNATYSKLPGNPCPSGAISRPDVAPK